MKDLCQFPAVLREPYIHGIADSEPGLIESIVRHVVVAWLTLELNLRSCKVAYIVKYAI